MTTLHEAAQQALEAMKFGLHVGFDESSMGQEKKAVKAFQQHEAAIEALRSALAQQGEQQRIQELEQELAAEIELRGKLEQECVNWRVKYTNLEMAQQGEQQPVAWLEQEWSGSGLKHLHFERREPTVRDEVVCPVWTPLYAGAAPAAQPDDSDINQVHAANAAVTYPSIHFSAPAAKPDTRTVVQQMVGALFLATPNFGYEDSYRAAIAAGQKLLKELK